MWVICLIYVKNNMIGPPGIHDLIQIVNIIRHINVREDWDRDPILFFNLSCDVKHFLKINLPIIVITSGIFNLFILILVQHICCKLNCLTVSITVIIINIFSLFVLTNVINFNMNPYRQRNVVYVSYIIHNISPTA